MNTDMMFCDCVFRKFSRSVVILILLFEIATTTLHMYHVCIKNEIISDFKPYPGLKLHGYVQLLIMDGAADEVQTLVSGAHQLCDTFYKTSILEGSEIYHFSAVLSAAREVKDVDGEAIKRLAIQMRPQFRKLHENVIFLEREILIFLSQYKRPYENSRDTHIGHKEQFEFVDEYLRQRRNFAYRLERKANSMTVKAKREDDYAYSGMTVLFFVLAYSVILFVFCGKPLRLILIFAVAVIAFVCIIYAGIHWENAREFRSKADRVSAEFNSILEEVRQYQDTLFHSRNATFSYFVKTADPKLVKQTLSVLVTFSELSKQLFRIDTSLQRLKSLVDSFEMNKKRVMLDDHFQRLMKQTFRNITSYNETIFVILQ